MWPYKEITREDFERIKDYIESIMIAHGAIALDVDLPYDQKSTSVSGDWKIEWTGYRKTYQYKDLYYRVDEVCFPGKPSIVIELGTYDELMKNIMEDGPAFPYDLSEEEFDDEISYLFGEKPYPENY